MSNIKSIGQGVRGYGYPKSVVSHWLWMSFLQQCCALTCYTVISISYPHFAYSLCHFHWALMKNKGCSLSLWTTNVKGQIERGYEKLRFLLQKAHPCVNARRLSHFASKSVGGLTSRGEPEKVRKSREVPIGNNVSPLIQGLCYRTACDRSHDLIFSAMVNWKRL